jgi:cytochrome c peroxidase
LLGKNIFFDKQLSTPRGKQACASCHDPRVGWTLPLGNINETTVGAPGAQPGALGGRKPQNNGYVAGFLGVYTPPTSPPFIGPWTKGGAFWDGRAEGCGASTNNPDCQVGSTGNFSETITPDDLPAGSPHVEFLGPVADQALNPTARPGVEQNTREKSDCQIVKTAKYKNLYEQAWGEPIDCKQQGDPPAYHISFKRIAVAVAAWQSSSDVNSFSSPRDDCILRPAQFDQDATPGQFPCANLSPAANRGHNLFFTPIAQGGAGCSACHNNKGAGSAGNEPDQIYTDMAYHSIALPFNRDLSRDDQDPGLAGHDDLGNNAALGVFKTPPLRNVGKNQLNITKAYMHNGYFKSLAQIVHYYNTRFDGTGAPTDFNPLVNSKTVCEAIGLHDATAAEAIANHCWPEPEFPGTASPTLAGFLGNLGLTALQEEDLVAYLQALSDANTPTAPSTVK